MRHVGGDAGVARFVLRYGLSRAGVPDSRCGSIGISVDIGGLGGRGGEGSSVMILSREFKPVDSTHSLHPLQLTPELVRPRGGLHWPLEAACDHAHDVSDVDAADDEPFDFLTRAA